MEPLSAHNRFELPAWLKTALVAVIILNVAAVITGAVLLWTNADTDSDQGKDIADLIAQQQDNDVAACERGNNTRLAEVGNLRSDVLVLFSDRALLEAVTAASPPSPLAEAYETSIRSKTLAIGRKQQVVDEVIESQAAVAVKPGSPVADCDKAYSLGP
jgi:hypothetical protein